MPIVFEEVIGEVEPTRGSQAAPDGAAAHQGPTPLELAELIEQHAMLRAERCRRSRAD